MTRFETCLKIILKAEGGYTCDPIDPGGATNCGITQQTYDHHRLQSGQARQPVVGITNDEISAIYRRRYWQPIAGDQLPIYLDLVVFDAAVNHGPRQSILFLQRALEVKDDGLIGPKTLSAIHKDERAWLLPCVIGDIFLQRRDFYEAIVKRNPTQIRFIKGWLNRLENLKKEIPHVDT